MENQTGIEIIAARPQPEPGKKLSFADVKVSINFGDGKKSSYDLSLFSSSNSIEEFVPKGMTSIKSSFENNITKLAKLTFNGETSGSSIQSTGTFIHFKYENKTDAHSQTKKITEKYFLNFEGQERDAIVTVKASDIKFDAEKNKINGYSKYSEQINYFASTIDYKLQIPSEKLEVTFTLNAKTGEVTGLNNRTMDNNDLLKATRDIATLRAHESFKDSDVALTKSNNSEKIDLTPSFISNDKYFDENYKKTLQKN